MAAGVAEHLPHRLAGLLGLARDDRIDDRGMVGEVAGEDVDGEIEHRAQDRIDRAAEAAQDRVVGGVEDRKVEALVGGDGDRRVVLPGFHGGQRRADTGEVFRCGADRCQRRRFRLDDLARLLQSEQQVAVEPVAAAHPAEHLTVEQGPIVLGAHLRAVARPHGEQALGDEGLHGFADDAAASSVALGELRLGRQDGSRRDLATHDCGPECRDHRADLSWLAATLHAVVPSRGGKLSWPGLARKHSSDV